MKFNRLMVYALSLLIFLSGIIACDAEKEVTERRNLMMPKKSELPRNSRYKENDNRKTNKTKQKRKKNKRLF
jgi:hypothetical protein